jgi:hypothetical protein
MKRLILACVFVLALAGLSSAQTQVGSSSSVQWDQTAATLATANAMTFRHYDDGAVTGTVFTSVACAGASSPFVCTVAFPAYTPGNHTVAISAANAAGESAKSPTVAFTFLVVPTPPSNLRIVGGL